MSRTVRRQKGYRWFADHKSHNRNNPYRWGRGYDEEIAKPDLENEARWQRDCYFNDKFFRGAKQCFKENRRANERTELARIKKLPYNEQHYVDALTHDKGFWILW